MLRHHLPRGSRTVAGLGAGLVVASGIALVGATSPATAAGVTVVRSHTIDFSETRAKGHHEFGPDGVRVFTDPSDGTDPNPAGGTYSANKAAGYFEVAAPLSVAADNEPSLAWTDKPGDASTARPGLQLRVDFDGDGNIDGTLVGEPVYGLDWWLTGGSEQFVKDAAPVNGGGSGSTWHGTLDQWAAIEAFDEAEIITAGWSLGSGIVGDGTIASIGVGATTYTFAESDPLTETAVYENQVDLSQTRAKGSNEFLETGGVRVVTLASDGTDPDPAGGTYSANKAAGYFAADTLLADAGEPSLDYTATSGARPSVQLVTDFDGDGTADAILVGETVYGRDWWVPGSAKPFVKDGAPSHTGGSGSENHGLLAEWRAAFPQARILQAGWSLGSGVEGNGVINKITVGLTEFTPTGANRVPVAGTATGVTKAGRAVTVTLPGTDADGDALTYAAARGTVAGNRLTFTAPASASGVVAFAYTVSDGTDTADGAVGIRVDKAPTSLGLVVTPQKIVVGRRATLKVTVSSTGAESGRIVFFDGNRRLGAVQLKPNSTATFKTGKLARGQHAFKATYAGNGSTLAAQRTVRKQVRRG